MTPLQTLYKDIEDRMKKALGALQRELSEIRGGRASPGLVESIDIAAYGASTPLKQLAAITAPEPKLLVIQPWDPNLVTEIEKGIQKAGLGITPQVDGKIIRLPVPPLTMERREELTKLIHKMAEEVRVSIRGVRRDANELVKKLKSENKATEDDVFKSQEMVQKMTDRYIEQVNTLVKQKEQELSSA